MDKNANGTQELRSKLSTLHEQDSSARGWKVRPCVSRRHNNLQQNSSRAQAVVDLLKEAKLKVKLKKCSFFQREIEFLGHQISKNGITPTKSKIEALFRYKQPTTLKQLLSFLGLASYYRKFIDHFTMIAHALYECCI
jgi:hypothetical protein